MTFQYDANGNLLYDGTRGFVYDDENQLVRVTGTNVFKSEFTYDGKMRLRVRKEYFWQSSLWNLRSETRYIYDGNLVIQERNGLNLPVINYAGTGRRLLSRTDAGSGQTAYYHQDGNGNVTALVGPQQLLVAKYLYDPFGTTISCSGPLADANTRRWASQEFAASSGLYYFGRRFYDPSLCRWVNRDPITELGGANLYAYAGNSPIGFTDFMGLCPWYDDLAKWAAGNNAFSKDYLNHNLSPWLATLLDTADDLGTGLLSLPSGIGHVGEATGQTGNIGDEPLLQPLTTLGTGAGTYAGNPTLANSAGLFQDISTLLGTAAAGFSGVPSLKSPLFSTEAGIAEGATSEGAADAANLAKLKEYYRQINEYGAGGVKELENGKIRFYDTLTAASNPGEMAGARLVREWDPATGAKRNWYETIDQAGTVRSVAPKPPTNPQNHLIFDANGNYVGRR